MIPTSKGRFNLSAPSLQTSVFRVNPIRAYQFESTGTNANKRRKVLRNSPYPNTPPSFDVNVSKTLPFQVSPPQHDFGPVDVACAFERPRTVIDETPRNTDQNIPWQIRASAGLPSRSAAYAHPPDTSQLAAPVVNYGYDMHPPKNLPAIHFPPPISAPVTWDQSYHLNYPCEDLRTCSGTSPCMPQPLPSSSHKNNLVPLSTLHSDSAPAFYDLQYNSAPLPSTTTVSSNCPRQEHVLSTTPQRTLAAILASVLLSQIDNTTSVPTVVTQAFNASHALAPAFRALSTTEPPFQFAPITDDILMALTEPFLMSWCMRIQSQPVDPSLPSVCWNDKAQPRRPWTSTYDSRDVHTADYISNHPVNSSSEYGMYTS